MFEQKHNEDFYRFKIGLFNCISVSDGSYDYNPMHFFPGKTDEQVKGILSDHNLPTDKLISPYTFLYVDTGVNKILTDMGGGKLGPKTGNLIRNLKAAGVQPEDVTIVIITHAHPDHIGGTLDDQGNPSFPNARYYMWKNEWDFWFSEEAFGKFSEHLSKVAPIEVFMKIARGQLSPIKDRIELLTEETEVLPGIRVHFTPGHTPGHMVVSFSSEDEEIFFIGDAILFPFLLEQPDLHPVFDIQPIVADASKRKLCDLLAEKKAWVLAQHFHPFPSLGHIIKKGKGWQWQPLEVK
ncbi:MAG TPA: MBL fold metallo-hydrolase [Bacteroidales bacterium]|nr:MBL fold metallo-hydrolase [Bacteroidales bacterium]